MSLCELHSSIFSVPQDSKSFCNFLIIPQNHNFIHRLIVHTNKPTSPTTHSTTQQHTPSQNPYVSTTLIFPLSVSLRLSDLLLRPTLCLARWNSPAPDDIGLPRAPGPPAEPPLLPTPSSVGDRTASAPSDQRGDSGTGGGGGCGCRGREVVVLATPGEDEEEEGAKPCSP